MQHPLQPYLQHIRLDRLWRRYIRSVADGEIPGLGALGLPGLGDRSRLGFTGTYTPENASTGTVETLLGLWSRMLEKDVAAMKQDSGTDERERRIFELGMAFLHAASTARIDPMRELMEAGIPVNFQHPVTRQTALHIAAAGATVETVKLLVDTGQCDYLIRDRFERIPWDSARLFSRYPEVQALLLTETKKQAARESADLLDEHRKKSRIWVHQPWYRQALSERYGDRDDAATAMDLDTDLDDPSP